MGELIRRVLIANRGEIAVRIARAARELGIVPVGIASEADRHALHRSVMERSLVIGPARASESYLDIARVVGAARELGADAVHPGYGFLSERADFAQAVADAGLRFIGPSPATLAAAGDKRTARRIAHDIGLATLDGYDGDDQSDATLLAAAQTLGFPLLIKASNGGGGRGQRAVFTYEEFLPALAAARREAKAAFGDDSVLLERYVIAPRHIEFQILADDHGNVVHLGERDCSLQRRRQKVFEEAPAFGLGTELRERMGAAAVALARATAYRNAGTVEFLLDASGAFFFLEINARLQVEHPVTELVHGVDLVAEQFRIAAGEALTFTATQARGHAIEVRLCAEDPAHDLLPAGGTIGAFRMPEGAGVRVDGGVRSGSVVPLDYDSLLGKISVWAPTREAALARMHEALAGTIVDGVVTNLALLHALVDDPRVRAGAADTTYIDESGMLARLAAPAEPDQRHVLAAAAALLSRRANARLNDVGIPLLFTSGARSIALRATREDRAEMQAAFAPYADLENGVWRIESMPLPGFDLVAFAPVALAWSQASATQAETLHVRCASHAPDDDVHAFDAAVTYRDHGMALDVAIDGDTASRRIAFTLGLPPRGTGRIGNLARVSGGAVTAPMPGRVLAVTVIPGASVADRDVVVILEAMKMEHRIDAGSSGVVTRVHVREGDTVAAGAVLLDISAPSPAGEAPKS